MQNMKRKLVSVIIPTYLRPDNILRAIDSVLKQTYKPIEIIIVDDNGINTSFQIETEKKLQPLIDERKIVYIKHEINKNGSAARNTGLKASHGDFINFLDDDDIFMSDKIQKQISNLEKKTSDFGGITCNIKVISSSHSFYTNNLKEGNLAEPLLCGKMRFNTSSILFRREVLEEINGFDETFYRHQDWELYIRFFRKYKMAVSQEVLLHKISTPNVLSKSPLKAIEYKYKFLDTFKDDILKMNHPNQIYKYQYETLALFLLQEKCKTEGISYLKKAASYGCLSFYTLLKTVYYLIK